MAGVEDYLLAAQVDVVGEELLVLLDVGRALSPSIGGGLRTRSTLFSAKLVLQLFFTRVRDLHPVVAEDLHAVVFVRIVRGGDGNCRHGVGGATEIGDARRGNDADQDWRASLPGDSRG